MVWLAPTIRVYMVPQKCPMCSNRTMRSSSMEMVRDTSMKVRLMMGLGLISRFSSHLDLLSKRDSSSLETAILTSKSQEINLNQFMINTIRSIQICNRVETLGKIFISRLFSSKLRIQRHLLLLQKAILCPA